MYRGFALGIVLMLLCVGILLYQGGRGGRREWGGRWQGNLEKHQALKCNERKHFFKLTKWSISQNPSLMTFQIVWLNQQSWLAMTFLAIDHL